MSIEVCTHGMYQFHSLGMGGLDGMTAKFFTKAKKENGIGNGKTGSGNLSLYIVIQYPFLYLLADILPAQTSQHLMK